MQHNDQYDAWMALDGIVYNITPYVRFHPGGGKELLRGAGRDGTKLFSKLQHRFTEKGTDGK